MAEGILRHLIIEPEWIACSAGSHPSGHLNPRALAQLNKKGIDTTGLSSNGWRVFENDPPDIVISVCDQAAGEACPIWTQNAVRAHWGVADPSRLDADEQEINDAFETTFQILYGRIEQLLVLPVETMSKDELQQTLNKIGAR